MRTERDVSTLLRSWLRTDVDGSVDHVIDAILSEVTTTPQRRSTWWPARSTGMSLIVRVGVTAAVLVMAIALGYSILNNVGTTGPLPGPTESPTPLPSRTPSALPPGRCLATGMFCLGVLEPGEHPSELFDPFAEEWDASVVVHRRGAMRYVAPEGWANADDRTHFYTLLRAVDYDQPTPFDCLDCPDGVWIGASPAAATLDCTEQADEAVGTSAEALAEWIRGHPGLDVTEGSPLAVDGRSTFVLDVTVSEGFAGACFDAEKNVSFVPLFFHPGYSYGIATGDSQRLFLVEVAEDRAMLIGVDSADPEDLDAVIAETQPIIESIRLTPP